VKKKALDNRKSLYFIASGHPKPVYSQRIPYPYCFYPLFKRPLYIFSKAKIVY